MEQVKIKNLEPIPPGYKRIEIPVFFDLKDDREYWLKVWKIGRFLKRSGPLFHAVIKGGL